MQVNVLRLSVFIALAVVLNSVVALTVRDTLLVEIETRYIETQNQFLDEVGAKVQTELAQPAPLSLSEQQMRLEARYDTQALVVRRNADFYSQSQLSEFAELEKQQALVDYLNATLYFVLNDNEVLEIGPLVDQDVYYYLVDWFDWLISAFLNLLLLLVFWYLNIKERNVLAERLAQMPVALSQPQDLKSSLQQLSQLVDAQLNEGEARITLQRDLLHGVAHEFRSPMARMQFALDMLEDAEEEEREALHTSLNQSLQDLEGLVSELLYYARVKDNSVKPKQVVLQMSSVLQETLDKVAPFYPQVDFELDAQEIHWQGDEALVKRLFTNLLRNAGRFARQRVRVELREQSGELVVRVIDDGIGIPPGKQARIFEPFTRLDPSRSRDSGGCGLGLAIVQSIVSKHDGTVRVSEESTDLGGACFEIRLPKRVTTKSAVNPVH
ncbi:MULTISPECIES: ATP-binding protein [unclassified Pseudoalteromonas]|uniref:sensor histidine kinase n=1 Tax=unclassified Pseudoalteromonas TaxID=194690 RepID=UPI0018915B1D|nr:MULTISPECIES: ATP-binding protein [unclassified Pseudoalteromonas]MCG7561299.1 ATP-binding protein [Pseudoalteromonas sp. McH1-42]